MNLKTNGSCMVATEPFPFNTPPCFCGFDFRTLPRVSVCLSLRQECTFKPAINSKSQQMLSMRSSMNASSTDGSTMTGDRRVSARKQV